MNTATIPIGRIVAVLAQWLAFYRLRAQQHERPLDRQHGLDLADAERLLAELRAPLTLDTDPRAQLARELVFKLQRAAVGFRRGTPGLATCEKATRELGR